MSRTTAAINRIKEDLDRISGLTGLASDVLEIKADEIHAMVEWILNDYQASSEDEDFDYDEDYVPSAENGDYSPGNPWDAPGMSIHDFI